MNRDFTNTCMVFFPLLVVTLAVFKQAGKLDISWWWVFSPIWMPSLMLIGTIAAIVAFIALILRVTFSKSDKK
ncbi:MAG: hypothetical protein HXN98_08795 [Prevotella salivae]|nr:hypothetical protein [Segatella salivae]